MTVSIPFQQEFTWRKLGYLYFSNSLDYRQVLEQNPQWNVTRLPPVGAQIRIQPTTDTTRSPGALTQGAFISGLPSGKNRDKIYPFDTPEEYETALNRYTLKGVLHRQTLNGPSFDNAAAITGNQTARG